MYREMNNTHPHLMGDLFLAFSVSSFYQLSQSLGMNAFPSAKRNNSITLILPTSVHFRPFHPD
jgi:hypothetical protein